MQGTEKPVLQCMAVGSIPRPVSLAQKGKCSECSIEVWMAPSSVNLLKAEPETLVVCHLCGPRLIASMSAKPIFALAPGALEEVIAEKIEVHNN